MSVQITMVAAPTSAGTGESVMSVTVPLDTNSWTKRPVEVKKKVYQSCCYSDEMTDLLCHLVWDGRAERDLAF